MALQALSFQNTMLSGKQSKMLGVLEHRRPTCINVFIQTVTQRNL